MKRDHPGKHAALFTTALAGGGAERMMLNLAEEFMKRGLAVDFVVTRARGAYIKRVPKKVRLVDLMSSRIITALPSLVLYLRKERPQAMLSALKPANCLAVWARILAQVDTRLILSERSILSLSIAGDEKYRTRLMPKLMRWTYPRADAVVAISAGVADDLTSTIGLSREAIDVIYNPAYKPDILKDAEIQPNHPWLLTSDVPVIVSVGRLVPVKDFLTLMQAFAVLRRVREARLVILGEGEARADIECLAQKLNVEQDVELPGFVDNPYSYMRHAALVVMSSRWEGFGNVLVEAMACGTPVVSTDCPGGPREILEGGKWGRLVPPGDSTALAHAILNSLQDPGLDPRERAFHFSVNRAADSYLNLLFPPTDG